MYQIKINVQIDIKKIVGSLKLKIRRKKKLEK